MIYLISYDDICLGIPPKAHGRPLRFVMNVQDVPVMYLFYQLPEEKKAWILVYQQISLENLIKITHCAVLGSKTPNTLPWLTEDPDTISCFLFNWLSNMLILRSLKNANEHRLISSQKPKVVCMSIKC